MPEIRYLLAECNFTEDERTLFDMRCVDVPLEECAERMNVSLSTAKRLNKRIKCKIDKLYMWHFLEPYMSHLRYRIGSIFVSEFKYEKRL